MLDSVLDQYQGQQNALSTAAGSDRSVDTDSSPDVNAVTESTSDREKVPVSDRPSVDDESSDVADVAANNTVAASDTVDSRSGACTPDQQGSGSVSSEVARVLSEADVASSGTPAESSAVSSGIGQDCWRQLKPVDYTYFQW